MDRGLDKDRFLSLVGAVDANGCAPWNGRRYRDGYGEFRVSGRSVAAHRVAVWIKTGAPVPEGCVVCHTCDHPWCVNPDHLFVGTQSDNERDKLRKGRAKSPFGRGVHNNNAKLTEAEVVEIRFLARDGARIEDLASRFRVSSRTVYDAVRGRTFWHLPIPAQPRRRKNKNSPVQADGSIKCSGCDVVKTPAEFAPSVVRRGRGWCRVCYQRWEKTRE